jgi:hypothetical protein
VAVLCFVPRAETLDLLRIASVSRRAAQAAQFVYD